MSIDKIVECLDRIRFLVQVSNVAYLMTEDDKTALAEAIEILENLDAEDERMIRELEDSVTFGVCSKYVELSRAIEVVKRSGDE